MVVRDSSHACDLCMYDVASGVNFGGKIFAGSFFRIGEKTLKI